MPVDLTGISRAGGGNVLGVGVHAQDEVSGLQAPVKTTPAGFARSGIGEGLWTEAMIYGTLAGNPQPAGFYLDGGDAQASASGAVLGVGAALFGAEAVLSSGGAPTWDRLRTHGRQTVTLLQNGISAVVDLFTGLRDFNAVVVTAFPAVWDIRLEGAVTNVAAQYTQLIQITNATGVNVPVGNNNTNRTPWRFVRVRRADANVGAVSLGWIGVA